VGVLSERDYPRKVILQGRSSKDTLVRQIMTTNVVTVTVDHTIPQCMALINSGGFRHLPVVASGKTMGVLSSPALLKEVRNAKITQFRTQCAREIAALPGCFGVKLV
jgi:CBS domain-containing protein